MECPGNGTQAKSDKCHLLSLVPLYPWESEQQLNIILISELEGLHLKKAWQC